MRRFSFWILWVFLFTLLRLPFFVEPIQNAEAYLSPDEPCGEVSGISQYTTNPTTGGVPDSGRVDFERALWSETVPAWSPTNLVYTTYSPGVTGTAIVPTSRLCFDPQGNVYNEQAWAWNSNAGWIDFDWCDEFSDPSSCASMVPSMDLEMTVPTSGPQSNRNAYWGGYAWSDNIGWIQFDWTCSGCDLTQRVHTQLPSGWPDNMAFAPHDNMNGEVDGYAWNDRIGWINFGHTTGGTLTQELPFEETLNVLPAVTLTPDPVDVTKYGLGGGVEPVLADGEDAYVLSVKLLDVDSGLGLYLDNSYDVDITVTPTADSFVGTYQTTDGDPSSSSGLSNYYGQPQLVKRGASAPYVVESEWIVNNTEWQARNLDAVFIDDVAYNAATQAFEVQIKSWAPTSNMNGADDNGDGVIDRYFDRDSNTATPSIDRNKWAIESIAVAVNSGPHTVALNTGAAPLWGLDVAAPGDPIDLKFAPALEITNFAYVDATDYDDDGDTDDLLSYIPSFTPVTAPYTLSLPFEGLVGLWSNALQTLPGVGLNFSVDVDLQTLDTDPQPSPYSWSFGLGDQSSSTSTLYAQLSGLFNSIPSINSVPLGYKWHLASPPTLYQPSYRLFLNSIMGSSWGYNFNGAASSILTDYAGRSVQYVPPLASSVDFEPFGESYAYGVDNSTGPSPTDWGLVPYYGHELESATVKFCPFCTSSADLLGYSPTVLPQFSYHASIAYDAYLGLNASGKEMYTRISYYNNEVPSVGSLAPSPYLYDVPVLDEECPGCSGVDVPGRPGYGSPNAPWIGGGAPVSGIPTLLTDDGLKLPAKIVGSISGANVASGDGTTVVGAASRTKIRNQIYKRFSQLKKGVNLGSDLPFGSGVNEISLADGAFVIPDSGGCAMLLNGDLIYCLEDTELTVGSGIVAYPQTTIVVEGGDLYVSTNVRGDDRDALGLVVFEDLEGVGGNIYISNSVTDLVRVNMYADGSVRSYDATSFASLSADPTPWTDFPTRSAALTNQLYIGGSVVSANTLGGLATAYYDDPPASPDDLLLEVENDLNNLREFQVCWYAVEADSTTGEPATNPVVPVDTDGGGWWNTLLNQPDPDDIVSCGPEYLRSDTLGSDMDDNEPVRIEYLKPPPGLPLLGGVR